MSDLPLLTQKCSNYGRPVLFPFPSATEPRATRAVLGFLQSRFNMSFPIQVWVHVIPPQALLTMQYVFATITIL